MTKTKKQKIALPMSMKQVSNKATLDAGKVSYFTMNDRKEPSLGARRQVEMKRQRIDK